jgi:hypothetical protein
VTDEVDSVLWVVKPLMVFEDILVTKSFESLWASGEIDLRERLRKEVRDRVAQRDVDRMEVPLLHLVEHHTRGIGEKGAFTIPLRDQPEGLSFEGLL